MAHDDNRLLGPECESGCVGASSSAFRTALQLRRDRNDLRGSSDLLPRDSPIRRVACTTDDITWSTADSSVATVGAADGFVIGIGVGSTVSSPRRSLIDPLRPRHQDGRRIRVLLRALERPEKTTTRDLRCSRTLRPTVDARDD